MSKGGLAGILVGGALVISMVAAWQAKAADCGNTPQGLVPCACQDTVVGSVTLTPNDPVIFDPTTQPNDVPCSGFGLKVQADNIVLDCAGLSIRGSQRSVGINVVKEGITVKNCIVDSFSNGIQVGGKGNHSIENNVVLNNKKIGMKVTSKENVITSNIAIANGQAGFDLRAKNNEISGNISAINLENGFFLRAQEYAVEENLAVANGQDGFTGQLSQDSLVSTNKAINNGGNGMSIDGGNRGTPSSYADNLALSNGADGVRIAGAANNDDHGNRGVANGGAVQCEIAGVPCATP